MSIMSAALGSALGSAGGGLASIPAQAIGSLIGGRINRFNAKQAQKNLFPGAHTWDLLGSSAAGASAGSAGGDAYAQMQAQRQLTKMQTDTQKEVAETQAEATKYAADRTSEAARGKMDSEVAVNQQNLKNLRVKWRVLSEEEKSKRLQNVIHATRAKYSVSLTEAEIISKLARNALTVGAKALSDLLGPSAGNSESGLQTDQQRQQRVLETAEELAKEGSPTAGAAASESRKLPKPVTTRQYQPYRR